jgi:hypothetical protein
MMVPCPGHPRQAALSERDGSGWRVFEHLCRLESSDETAIDWMTPEQRELFAFKLLRQEVNHGGFDYFFRYRGRIGPYARQASFARPAWAALIDEACVLMGVPYPSSTDGFCGVLDQLEAEDPAMLARLDDRFYQLEIDEPPDELIDRFIWSHKPAFFT